MSGKPGKSGGARSGHGGRRAGAGRPSLNHVRKTYWLEPPVVDAIKRIAKSTGETESAIANAILYRSVQR